MDSVTVGSIHLATPLRKKNMQKSTIYDASSTFTSCVDEDILLHRICESTKKQLNSTHHKPHMQLLKKASTA
jgi:hypothetical protein